ncbi:cupin domain-containing protein [Marinicella sediminis]|uniref:Cupin domain-containing protein n=1 Tax=Marinicella sediminis TaxID=1792834 RepID=A0ABV7J985_9GAMM|nr:cupin domain-containing protein [Marinicella sediminis]
MNAKGWIEQLRLEAHPEGGYFRETYRCQDIIRADNLPERFSQAHCFSTAIYYLLEAPDFSAFHRIKQDELWHFYQGSGLTIHVITAAGEYQTIKLGNDPAQGQSFQAVVHAGDWFAATVDDPDGFALVGCTVAPGFEFADFELAESSALIAAYPDQQDLIQKFSRSS